MGRDRQRTELYAAETRRAQAKRKTEPALRPESPPPEDLPALTSLRFAAAAMIFVFHLREFAPTPLIDALGPAMYHGVSFFFVLSGFVLTHVYSRRTTSVGRFYLARVARIVPLHLATLALLIAILPLPAARGQTLDPAMTLASFIAKLLMLDAWIPVRGILQSWNNVSWSISVEMAFYAVFPLLLVAMKKSIGATLAAAALVCAAVFAAAIAYGAPVFVVDRMTLTLFNLGSCFPLARGFEFALGMAASLAWRRWIAPAKLSARLWTGIEGAALFGVTLWLVLAVPALVGAFDGPLFVWLRASGSCWAFALLIMVMAGGRGAFARALSIRPLVALGEASFAFYMIHMIVMRALRFYLGPGPGALSALAVALSLGFLLHEAVEKPMRRRLLNVALRPLAPAAASPQP
jgi:peptidoglycan/LPS O-acetylase OafA/YrhL